MPPLDVDALILDLVATGRYATPDEVAALVAHVARARFTSRLVKPPSKDRISLAQVGIILPPGKTRSIEWHLLKRIYIDNQWPIGTSETQFEADLHQAILHPQVQIWTYRYTTHPYLGFMAPSHRQDGLEPEALIFVAYTPVFGTITTGYQTSGTEKVFTEEVTDVIQHR